MGYFSKSSDVRDEIRKAERQKRHKEVQAAKIQNFRERQQAKTQRAVEYERKGGTRQRFITTGAGIGKSLLKAANAATKPQKGKRRKQKPFPKIF